MVGNSDLKYETKLKECLHFVVPKGIHNIGKQCYEETYLQLEVRTHFPFLWFNNQTSSQALHFYYIYVYVDISFIQQNRIW